jgi:hypothetical protein
MAVIRSIPSDGLPIWVLLLGHIGSLTEHYLWTARTSRELSGRVGFSRDRVVGNSRRNQVSKHYGVRRDLAEG